MPLTEYVSFKAKLQRNHRIVVPKNYRWRYKMEKGDLLTVIITPLDGETYEKEEFLARMASDGRLTVPKVTIQILRQKEEKELTGILLQVEIEPTAKPNGVQSAGRADQINNK